MKGNNDMKDIERFVLAVDNEKVNKAKEILEKILKNKVVNKIKSTLNDEQKS